MKTKNHRHAAGEAMSSSSTHGESLASTPIVLRAMTDLSVEDIVKINGSLEGLRKKLAELATMQTAGETLHYTGYHISAAGIRLITHVEVQQLSSLIHEKACCLVYGPHPVTGSRAERLFFGASAASQAVRNALIEIMALCLVCDRNGGFQTIENSHQIWEASDVLQRLMHKHPSF